MELHLSGLIGTVKHPDMQKIRIIGFFFENMLHWQFEVGKKLLKTTVLGCVFMYVKKHYYVTPCMYLTTGGNLSNKKMLHNCGKKLLTRRAKTIRIIGRSG